jgi:tetratricopeptide (TPR) repeat protein
VKRTRGRTQADPSRPSRPWSGRPKADAPKAATGVSVEIRWAEIAELTSLRERAEFIDRHADLVQAAVVSNLTALIPQLVKSDRNKALAVAETALMIAHRLGDAECVALSLRARANAHYSLGQSKTALENHAQALRLFRSLGHSEQVARTLSSSIQPLILQGRYRQAFAAAREARKIFTQQQNQWRVARLDLNLGNILDRQDRFAEALECYKRAYRYLSVHGQDDPEAVAVALHNMAVLYVRLNDFRAAEGTYEKARTFAAAHDMPVLVGQADYNIAWLHYLRGDYSRAISMLRAARETCRSTGDEYHVALCYLDLSEIYLELNLIAEAAETAEQASASFSELGMQYEKGKSLTNLAVALSQQGEAARSLELFLAARQIFAQEKNKLLPSVIDQYRALVLFSEERDAEARELCTAALHVLQKFRLTNKAVGCRLLLARLYLRQAHPGQKALRAAQQHCARALKTLKRVELPVLSCQAYALRGQIHAAAGHDRLSYAAYVQAKRYLDSLRNRIHAEELKISFMKDRVEIYEALVALCLKRPNSASVMSEVFGYVEQAKSRTLFDFLSVSQSPGLGPEGQSEHAKRMRELREELNWYFHQTEMAQLKESSRHQVTPLRAESHRRERELLKLSREHGAADEPLAPHTAAEVQLSTTYTPHRVRESLPANVTILEYFEVQGKIIVLLLSHDRFQIVPLGELSRISTLLDLLQFQLSKLRLGADYVKNFAGVLLSATRTHLHDLYKLLIDPVRESLKGGHLVIAPHGLLHQLPFQALFDGGRYLIDEFTLSYAPSASVYSLCRTRTATEGGDPLDRGSLVLGIPDALVPFVQDEVEAVAASLPDSEVLSGEKATAERLRAKGSQSRFIHIATHGYFRRDNPMFSGIRLGDSYLSLYDLYQLKLPAELVALSGCSTGLNVVAAGDELMGLARGLLRAGAETSMLTLWDVQDESTAQLMKFFYSHLAGGRSKAVALQQAMLGVKSTHPHPYYWAPFVLVGKA